MSSAEDPTSEDEALEALRESIARHRRLVELAPDGIVVYQDGRFVYANPAATRMLGLVDPQAALGKPILDFVHPDHHDTMAERLEGINRGEAPMEAIELLLLRPDGTAVEVEISLTPLILDGRPAAQSIVRDISARKRGQERLMAAALQAQEALRLREDFLSVAAHELKTPVTSLWSAAQILQRLVLPGQPHDQARLERMVTVVTQQTEKLTRLVNRLLDISRLEAGKLSLELQWIDVAGLARTAVEGIQAQSDQHELSVSAPDTLWARADPLRIEQILVNLLTNAIKYSPQGGSVQVAIVTRDDGYMELRVTDEGIGVPLEDQPHIFERFFQVQPAERATGLGLGLFISREIAMLHGGDLRYEARPTRGSCFVVTLPTRGPQVTPTSTP